MCEGNAFDPAPHLQEWRGKGLYLPTRWRIVWLRSAHPDATITTEIARWDDTTAVVRATIAIPGGGTATGYGTESITTFPDGPIEAAETKAIGRACAALGFGTANAGRDFDEGDRIVDGPVEFPSRASGRPIPPPAPDAASQKATERQVKFIFALAREAGLNEQELGEWSRELYNVEVEQLTRRDAGTLIESLQRRRNEVN